MPKDSSHTELQLSQAIGLHRQGQLEEAADLYRVILAEDPTCFDALHLLGVICNQKGEPARAIELFERALERNPLVAAGYYNLGVSLEGLRRGSDALVSYDRALELNPDFAEAHNNRGSLLLAFGRSEEALAHFEHALRFISNNADIHRNYSLALHGLNRLDEALASSEHALQLRPDFAEAWYGRGNILQDLKATDAALESYDYALRLRPDYLDAHYARGNAFLATKRFGAALENYERTLQLKADHIEALNNRGIALHNLGQLENAVASYNLVLHFRPDFVEALNNLGRAISALKGPGEAIAVYDRALQLQPNHPASLNNRGYALLGMGRLDEALADFNRLTELEPHSAIAYNGLGSALRSLKRFDEALASFKTAFEIAPDFADARNNYGAVLQDLMHVDEALAAFEEAIQLRPDYAEAWSNRGNALRELLRSDEALASYDQSLKIKPDYVTALSNRANLLLFLRRFKEAAETYAHLLSLDPQFEYALGYMFHTRLHDCDWNDYEEIRARILTAVENGEKIDWPFSFLSYSANADTQFKCAKILANDRHAPAPITLQPESPYRHEKIRIAYLSADFRVHPVMIQLAGVLERHDKTRFEIFGISFGPRDSGAFQERLVAAFDRLEDVRGKSDLEIAMLLRDMEIDIAVDLMGYTHGGRPNIFSFRPAPVQVGYLGYPGTMGTAFIDYILADNFVAPEENQQFFSEHVAALPGTFMATDKTRCIAEGKPSRAEAGLPETGFVFCSFNSLYKLTPEMFSLWMRLLGAVEGSVLWLPNSYPVAISNLRVEAAARGISPDRLVVASFVPSPDEHLARMRLADLFLDTLPYNAHASACDALWAGLPLITCAGNSFASRVAGSLLRAVGLPELVTHNLEDYESLAFKLATTPGMLAGIKKKLARNRVTYPLFDTDRFRRHIESAYIAMHGRYVRGEPPASFEIPAM